MPKYDTYQRHGLEVLKCSFPRLSVRAIEKTFKLEYNFSFTSSFNALRDIRAVIPIDFEAGAYDDDDDVAVHERILEVAPFLHTVNQTVLKHERQVTRLPRKIDPGVLREMSEIDEYNDAKENFLLPNYAKGQPKEAEEDGVLDDDETPVCGCCMNDILASQMVFCNAPTPNPRHSFCKDCLRHHVSEQLYGKNQALVLCMSMDGCTGTFGDDTFDAVLSPKTRKNYNVLVVKAEAKKAGIDLCQCPRCGGEYGNEKGRRNLACPLCKFSWCLKCQKASHKGQTCQEAAQLNARSHAEDAITAAVVRRCPNPKCNVPFQKGSDNECNKIKCASCGTISCYLCRQEIKLEKPYHHFCRIAHCQHTNCGKCILFTKATEDDERARRQVALAQVQQARAAGHDIETLLSPQRPLPRQAQVATNQAGVPARVVVNQEQPEAQPAVAGRGEREPALVADVPVAAQEVAAGREAPVVVANNQVRGDDPPAHVCVIM